MMQNSTTQDNSLATKADVGSSQITKAEIKAIKQILIEKQEAYSGPLPHPDHFNKYNKSLPGSGNRLLTMVEKDLAHRHFCKNYMAL